MKAVAFVAVILALLFILRHAGEKPRLMVDASAPTESAPLMLPPQFCPSPWPICPNCAKPRSTA